MGIFSKAADGLRKLTGKVKFPGQALAFFNLNRATNREMEQAVGDGTSSDVLMTPIRWLQRAIVEPPWQELDDKAEPILPSELVDLLDQPVLWEVLEAHVEQSLLDLGAFLFLEVGGGD